MTTVPPTPALPEKPATKSNGMWAAAITFVIGVLTSMGISSDLLQYIGANVDAVIGAVMAIFGVWSGYARARARTALKL